MQAPRKHTVSTTGESEFRVDPTLVTVQITARSRDAKSSMAASQKNAEKEARILDTLRKHAAVTILRTDVSLRPIYKPTGDGYNVDRTRIEGYEAETTIVAETAELGKVGSLIDAVTNTNLSELMIDAIDFSLDRKTRKKQMLRALKFATYNAKKKAQVMAKALDQKIDGIETVSEESSFTRSRAYYNESFAASATQQARTETEIVQSPITVRASVSLIVTICRRDDDTESESAGEQSSEE